MDTTTMKRKARQQGRRVRHETARAGGVVKDRAVEAGEAVRTTAGDLGRRAAERTKGPRQTVGYWIAGEKPRKRRTGRVLLAGAAGATAAFFLDPSNGKRRRDTVKQWVATRFGRGTREFEATTWE
jgi:hypothetical protein